MYVHRSQKRLAQTVKLQSTHLNMSCNVLCKNNVLFITVQIAAGVVLVSSVCLFNHEALVAIIFTVRNIDHLHSVYRRIFMNLCTPWDGERVGEGRRRRTQRVNQQTEISAQ